MNPAREPAPFPDSTSVIPELIFGNYWSPEAVSRLIRSKCAAGETPAFLFLGRKEAGLLREHLAEVFGTEAVATLHETYYMGLKVVEIQVSSFFYTGGRKRACTLQDPGSRRPAVRDRASEMLWPFRI